MSIPPFGVSRNLNDVPELSLWSLRFMVGEEAPEGVPLQLLTYYISDLFWEAGASLTHIGPLRQRPERAYRLEQATSMIGTSFGTVASMAAQRETARDAARALRDLGVATDVEVADLAPGYVGVLITDPESGRKVNLADVGFGISQVLPILVSLITAEPRSLVLLEQPELHLHPRTQVALADYLVNQARSQHTDLFIESHSEHVLLRLQRRVASGDIPPEELAIYVVEGGGVNRVHVDRRGRLDPGALPRDFFEEDWTEAVELAKEAART